MGRDFADFVMLKLFCYFAVALPISGVCWLCFSKWDENGVVFAIGGTMLLLHLFATEENLGGYRWQRWFVMRYRHYLEMKNSSVD